MITSRSRSQRRPGAIGRHFKRRVEWLSRKDKGAKEARDKRIFEMWLACHTQQEIAAAVAWERQTIAGWIKGFTDFGNVSESGKAAASHADFDSEESGARARPVAVVWVTLRSEGAGWPANR
jgi:hypothetical protein